MTSEERQRVEGFGKLEDGLRQASDWYLWGPYVTERQWGTVREDYSPGGDAWDYLPHDHARSRAYRWGEDGLAGFCDIEQRLCLGLALWNGRDPILKERIFGLTGTQGNHGEDAKEYWWYSDAIPSHAWNRWRYHYPQAAFPYGDLVAENGRRNKHEPEYELLDTGAFDDDRYWIVEVDYAKASPFDLLVTVRVTNAGPDTETLHVLPTAWFRNTWSWRTGATKPTLKAAGRSSIGGRRTPSSGDLELRGRTRARRRATEHALLRERDQHAPRVRDAADDRLPEGRDQRPRRRWGGDREPRRHRYEGRLLVPAGGRARRHHRGAPAPPARRRRTGRGTGRGVRARQPRPPA